MLGPVSVESPSFHPIGGNHPVFHAVTVWPEGDSLRDYPMCQNAVDGRIPSLCLGDPMRRFVEGVDRSQTTLFPESLDDWVRTITRCASSTPLSTRSI